MPVNGDPPTPRQLEVLRLLAAGVTVRRDLARELRIGSTNAVQDLLERLRDRGLVDWTPLRSAAVRLTLAGWAALGPCECVLQARREGWIARLADGSAALAGLAGPGTVTPITHCPWCGRPTPRAP